MLIFFLSRSFTEEKRKTRPDKTVTATIKTATKRLTGAGRREFQAAVTLDHCRGSPRFARELFGWSPDSIRKGLVERETGEIIPDAPRKGRTAYSEKLPRLQSGIRSLVDPNSQTHPSFETKFRDTRMTAKAVHEALVREKGYKSKELPGKTGYRLRRVQKTKPQKKFPKPTRSSQTSKRLALKAKMTAKQCEYR